MAEWDVVTAREGRRAPKDMTEERAPVQGAAAVGAAGAALKAAESDRTPAPGPTSSSTGSDSVSPHLQGPDINVPAYSGVAIPLPDAQVMSADITANPENTVFQVNKKGVYLLSYRVNLTQPAQVGTKLILNNMARTISSVIPVVPTASFENQYTRLMNAGETLQLQLCAAPLPGLSPKAQTVTLAGNGMGASLSIILLEER